MSLHAALSLLLEEFPKAKRSPFKGSPIANFVRHDIPAAIRGVVGDNERYLIKASPGKGNWARSPWAAIFDRLITDTAQDGYYLVYLVKEDFSGAYLSLNQGITAARQQYGADAKSVLRIRAADFRAKLTADVGDLLLRSPDLAPSSTGALGSYYECGSICGKLYAADRLPTDEMLAEDLRRFLNLYLELVSREASLFSRADEEEDEIGLCEEDLTVLRHHKRIERNKKLAASVKRAQGLRCQACGFHFQEAYGDLGKNFIEAHHLTPLHELKGQRLLLDPRTDFAVLCSNCHRMIHRTEHTCDILKFRNAYLKTRET